MNMKIFSFHEAGWKLSPLISMYMYCMKMLLFLWCHTSQNWPASQYTFAVSVKTVLSCQTRAHTSLYKGRFKRSTGGTRRKKKLDWKENFKMLREYSTPETTALKTTTKKWLKPKLLLTFCSNLRYSPVMPIQNLIHLSFHFKNVAALPLQVGFNVEMYSKELWLSRINGYFYVS